MGSERIPALLLPRINRLCLRRRQPEKLPRKQSGGARVSLSLLKQHHGHRKRQKEKDELIQFGEGRAKKLVHRSNLRVLALLRRTPFDQWASEFLTAMDSSSSSSPSGSSFGGPSSSPRSSGSDSFRGSDFDLQGAWDPLNPQVAPPTDDESSQHASRVMAMKVFMEDNNSLLRVRPGEGNEPAARFMSILARLHDDCAGRLAAIQAGKTAEFLFSQQWRNYGYASLASYEKYHRYYVIIDGLEQDGSLSSGQASIARHLIRIDEDVRNHLSAWNNPLIRPARLHYLRSLILQFTRSD